LVITPIPAYNSNDNILSLSHNCSKIYEITSNTAATEVSLAEAVQKVDNSTSSNIFIIGDSVDRISILDWCDFHSCQVSFPTKEYYHNFTKHHIKFDIRRLQVWEILKCDCPRRQVLIPVTIGFLFNKYGTSCCGYPWYKYEIHRMAPGLDPKLQTTNMTMEDMWNKTQHLGVLFAIKFMGDKALDVVAIASTFWDLATYTYIKQEQLLEIDPNIFITHWKVRVKKLITVIKSEFSSTFSKAPLFLWRPSNNFHSKLQSNLTNPSNRWLSSENLVLISEINQFIEENRISLGLDGVEKTMKTASSLRDHIHPHPVFGIHYVETLVSRTMNRTHLDILLDGSRVKDTPLLLTCFDANTSYLLWKGHRDKTKLQRDTKHYFKYWSANYD
jgi:hypothetical protein